MNDTRIKSIICGMIPPINEAVRVSLIPDFWKS